MYHLRFHSNYFNPTTEINKNNHIWYIHTDSTHYEIHTNHETSQEYTWQLGTMNTNRISTVIYDKTLHATQETHNDTSNTPPCMDETSNQQIHLYLCLSFCDPTIRKDFIQKTSYPTSELHRLHQDNSPIHEQCKHNNTYNNNNATTTNIYTIQTL